MKKNILATLLIMLLCLSMFTACNTTKEKPDTSDNSSKETEEVTTDETYATTTESEETTITDNLENMSQMELYDYLCNVVKNSSQQNQISVYYTPGYEGVLNEDGAFYRMFVDNTNGYKAYFPDITGETKGAWMKKDNNNFVYYVKDATNWETMEKYSYRKILEPDKDWGYLYFAGMLGFDDYFAFEHFVTDHSCSINIVQDENVVTIRFTPLEPRICDVCDENYYEQFKYYEYTVSDGLITSVTISATYGFNVQVTYQCGSFEIPSDYECPLLESE